MAEHGLTEHTADKLRKRMVSRFGFLHFNDRYHGRYSGEYEMLREMLSDEVIADEGSSLCVTEDTYSRFLDGNSFSARCG